MSGLLLRVFEALKVWSPNNNATKLLPHKQNLRLLVRLFVAVAINEEKSAIVDSHGPEIVRIVMSKRGSPTFLISEVTDEDQE